MKTFLTLALLSLFPLQMSGNPQSESGLEFLSLNVKAQVFSTQPDNNSQDLPDSITRPDPNAGRPRNRTETENERLERQTNQRIQNMHAVEKLKRKPPSGSS